MPFARRLAALCAAVVVELATVGQTSADERPAGQEQPTAGEVAGAPRPEAASGVLVPRDESAGWRWVPRVLLFVPRVAVIAALTPLRGLIWVYDRYELDRRFYEIFFNDSGTVGLYPVIFFESGQGFHGGATFVHRDLFGRRGHLRLAAGYGGVEHILLSGTLTTGRLLSDRLELSLGASYRSLTGASFYGYGNGDLVPADEAILPIDPRVDDTAVKARTTRDDTRVSLGARVPLAPSFHLTVEGGYKHVSSRVWSEARTDEDVSEVYDPDALTGLREGLDSLTGELELVFDTRRVIDRLLLSSAVPSTGWLLAAFGGYQLGLDDDPSRFGNWGFDAQRYIDLYGGDRTLVVRAFFEAVTGDLDHVPFIDLPSLGGPLRLRGYPSNRFRDRIASFATVEYDYPVATLVSGYLYSDVGRVYRSLDEIEVSGLRVGFGGGLQLHSLHTFVARLSLFFSKDGDVIFNLGFDPEFDVRSRRPQR